MNKSIYIAMVLAALILGGLMVRDLTGELRSGETQPRVSTQSRATVQGQPENGLSPVELSPAVESRINEILNDDSEDSISASSLVTESEAPAVTLTPQPELNLEVVNSPVSKNTPTAPPIRQQTPLHTDMLTPGNFVYLGGFRPEFGDPSAARFGFGGTVITYRPDGDPDGADDGHPGSLYLSGHRQQQFVAEISIPKPVVSRKKKIDDLSVGKILQPFTDITAGVRDRLTNGSSEPFEIGGLQVVGNRLHWTLYKYYNVTGVDYLSHGLSSVNLANKAVRGMWHLGPWKSGDPRWHSYKHAGYICEIPRGIANKYLGGRHIMSGLQISTGLQTSSQGPALFAYKVDDENLPGGKSLSAIPLLWYSMDAPVAQHHPADSWQGAEWLTHGSKQTVIVIGRKAHGPVHYGLPRPGECYDYKGYHGSSYEVQVLFYRVGDLFAAAKKQVATVQPAYRWDTKTPGGSLNRFMFQDCGKEIGGIAYDRERNLLYIAEVEAAFCAENEYEPLPVIHVLKVVE